MSPETTQLLADIEQLLVAQNEASGGSDGQFWRTLGQKHTALLEEYGLENFKRTINFEYGQWTVVTKNHPYTRRLLKLLVREYRLPHGLLAKPDMADSTGIRWPGAIHGDTGRELTAADSNPQHLKNYAIYCGLLWQFAKTRDAIGCLRLEEPHFGHPLPIRLFKRLITQDLAMSSLELNRIASHVDLSRTTRVLEIGGGYGRTAWALHKLFPRIQYFITDIPPALAVSQNYLAKVLPDGVVGRYAAKNPMDRSINFCLPHQLSELPDKYFDLCINLSSFDEMPPEISAGYLKEFDRLCSGHAFLNGHARTSNRGNRLGLDELPYNSGWQLVFSNPHAVVDSFVEKLFRL